jgi:CRISPR-associated protein Cas5h
MRVLAFRIFGDFAHFRKFYTTSSPLSFPFPPPPTIRGMVGAIMGFDKQTYLEKTQDLWISVRIDKPIRKFRMGLNIIFTKGSSGRFDPTLIPSRKGDVNKTIRTQVKAEFIKEPSYTIYLASENGILNELYDFIREHKTHYTVSLGLSELLADFELVGYYEAERQNFSQVVNSVIPLEKLKELDLERISKLGKDRIPVYLDTDRKVLKYEDVVFSMDGTAIYGKFSGLYRLGNGEVIHLWEPMKI